MQTITDQYMLQFKTKNAAIIEQKDNIILSMP